MALFARQAIRDEPRLGGRKLANTGLFLRILAIPATLVVLALSTGHRHT